MKEDSLYLDLDRPQPTQLPISESNLTKLIDSKVNNGPEFGTKTFEIELSETSETRGCPFLNNREPLVQYKLRSRPLKTYKKLY